MKDGLEAKLGGLGYWVWMRKEGLLWLVTDVSGVRIDRTFFTLEEGMEKAEEEEEE